MSNIEGIQKLLKDKADLPAQIGVSAFERSIELKQLIMRNTSVPEKGNQAADRG